MKKLSGDVLKEFESISHASNVTGVNRGNIQSACCGRVNQAGGYKWSYKNG